MREDIDAAILSVSILLCHDPESDYESMETHSFWQSFLKSLPLSNIVSLEVIGTALPNSIWIEIFAPLTNLKTIIINSEDDAAFFRITAPNSSNSITQPFPALSSVTVKSECDYLSIASSLDLRLASGLAPFKLVLYTEGSLGPHVVTRLRESALDVQIHSSVLLRTLNALNTSVLSRT
jgi:hypothetical protein